MNNDASILQIFNESGMEIPVQENELISLLHKIAEQEQRSFSFVEVVYVDEEEIVSINKEHLQREYVTDIISFNYDEEDENEIEGTLYCCAQRIYEQAKELNESELREFFRIFIHGVLHLIGYDDSSKEEKNKMTELENKYLLYTTY